MKTKITLLLLLATVFAATTRNASAQSERWDWVRGAGGSGYDEPFSITTDNDGNVYMTGQFSGTSIMFDNSVVAGSANNSYFIAKYSSTGEVVWAKSAEAQDPAGSGGYGICTDGEGNIYVTGAFRNTITFGDITLNGGWRTEPGPLGTDTVWVQIGLPDMFVVKYDTSGEVIWATNTSLADVNVTGQDIATNVQGNIYVTGTFRSETVTFGNTTLTNTAPLSQEIFVVKYGPSGDVLWARSPSGNFVEQRTYISADDNGNVYIAGSFSSPVLSFGNIVLTNALADSSSTDVFIAKFDALGNVVWAQRAGGIEGDEAFDIDIDESGDVYVTGSFDGESITIGGLTLPGNDICLNAFVFKLDSSGNAIWGSSNGNTFNNASVGISLDDQGNVYMAGHFAQTITIGSNILTSEGAIDVFIAKYNQSGEVLYAKSAGGASFEMPSAVAIDGNGNVFVAGYFISDSAAFGSQVVTNHSPLITGDIFIAKLSSSPTEVIQRPAFSNSADIYPNPFNGKFRVLNRTTQPIQLVLHNSMGEEIISRELTEEVSVIDVSNYPASIFLYRITSDSQTIRAGKIINL